MSAVLTQPTVCSPDVTRDAFLGGALMIEQPRVGYRSGMDAVLVAAGVRAAAGEHVLEAGAGVGATALCIARRVPGCLVTGIEIDHSSVKIAQRNVSSNGLEKNVEIILGDVAAPPAAIRAKSFDHFVCNPPYFDDVSSFRPPPLAKRAGNVGVGTELSDWIDLGLKRLRPKGTITLIHRTERLEDVLALFRGRVGDVRLFPFWPHSRTAAKRVLISGTKGSAAPPRLLPGIPLHEPGRRYSRQAEAILRTGNSLVLD